MSERIYISIDIESSGPIPGTHSMLSLGAAAFTESGRRVRTFYERLMPINLVAHAFDCDTLKWWTRFPEALNEALRAPQPPVQVMREFVEWVRDLGEGRKVTIVASPAGFDGMFVNWYAVSLLGVGFDALPWKHRVLDMRSYAAGKLGIPYHDAHNSTVCELIGFKPSVRHDHNALNDAIEQGETFCALMAHSSRRPEVP